MHVNEVKTLLEDFLRKGVKVLPAYESKLLASSYGIPVTKMRKASTLEEAFKAAEEIGFPLVMKILSPDIIHKTDVGGVVLNINSLEEVEKAYKTIMENVRKNAPNARIEGVVLEEMVEGGYEVIIGGIRDAQFGPTIMFGLGGIYVEVFKDVSFEIAPLTPEDALELVKSTKAYQILKGFRGMPEADIEALVNTIVKASTLIWDLREYIKEMDLNPVKVLPKGSGAKVIDARFVLEKADLSEIE